MKMQQRWTGQVLAWVMLMVLTLGAQHAQAAADAAERGTLVGWMELSGELPDGPPPFAWVTEEQAGSTLRSVLKQLRTVAQDDRYRGVVITLNEPQLSLSQIDEIAMAIRAARQAQKQVVVYAEQYNLPMYLLACEADRILLQSHGELHLNGLHAEEIYLAGLFEKLGLQADMEQVGDFKGASEQLMRHGPSDAWNENMDGLLDDLYEQIIERIARGRGMKTADVEKAIAQMMTMTDQDYVSSGLVDALSSHEVKATAAQRFGDAVAWDEDMGIASSSGGPRVDNPFALFSMLFQPRERSTTRQSLALINASGPITSGKSSYGGGLFSGETIGSRTMVEALKKAREDNNIKGVVIRMDSPGGSAIASEMVWQAVRETAEKKPVYMSVGSMAASGGYYIACAADRIYVTPTSIVGSIGVVGGKIVMGGLYEKLGVGVHRRSRGPLGEMYNSVEKFTDEQRKLVRASMQRVYDQFKNRVTLGRGEKIANVEAIAAGRIFTGRQAIANGMADELGGVHDALTAMATALNMDAGSYDIVTLPEPMDMGEFFEQLLGVSGVRGRGPGLTVQVESPLLQAARAALGEQAWRQVQRVGGGLMLLNQEPVLTLMPQVIVVK